MKQGITSLRNYWSTKVIMPIIFATIFLVAFLVGTIIFSSRNAEMKRLDTIANTLAVVLADPILLGDQLELEKRLSVVGSENDFDLIVKNNDGETIGAYPLQVWSHPPAFSTAVPIKAIDGRAVGQVSLRNKSRSFLIEPLSYSLLVFFFIFTALCWWLVRASSPILNDIFHLSIENQNSANFSFRFLELQEVNKTIKNQASALVEAEKNIALSEMATQVAHDVRSPIAALKTLESKRTGEALTQDELSLLKLATTRVRNIADDLLKTYKKSNQALKKIDVCTIIDECLVEIKARFPDVRFNFITKVRPIIAGDPSRFQRVVSNILNNACEAKRDSEFHEVNLMIQTFGAKGVKIIISDNGSGIAPELQTQIFHKPITDKHDGTGIGLLSAKQSLNSMSMDISFASQFGVGTAVTITSEHSA